ncbi:GTPase IMAP family member 8-like isoform X1 [Seriola aureovittata]|uniref:GTPase IMAP family member 8-like isoform X1 n=1 Tax=Seriola aureovittata TaxID=2871759 RepID=UPI0024BD7998|nr:GTPase IMAP family member 8-like isoform X1 [Seriola aureovittata]
MKKATSAKELNVVIVGSQGSHKDLVGNIILGRNAFDAVDATFDCEKGEGEVCERRVTLVQTPGWLRGYQLCDTAELFKTETILSVTLCPPGLHGFLLVINAELPFTDVYKKATKEHLEYCFGEKVWDHTVVVFSHRGDIVHETIEDYISKEGAPLQPLLEACGNRYHVLCDDGTDKSTNVRQLFEKLDTMVAENSCYEVESRLIQTVEERRKEVDKKAEELRLQTQEQRQRLRRLLSEPKPSLRILMVGWVFSGKSAAGNRILRSEVFHTGERTMKALKQSGEVAGREVMVVDTPGWWKFFPASFIPEVVKSEILEGVSLCSPSPNVILLVVPPDTSFTDEQKRVTEDNMKLLGQRVWRHVIVLFTSGDTLGNKSIEQHIESEGKPLRGLIEKCGKRYHVLDNTSEAGDQVTELLEKMEEMVAGNYSLHLSETDDPQQEEKSDEPTKNKDENTAKEITEQLNIKWDRKNWEEHCTLKGDDSMDLPMNFSEDKQRLKDFKAEEEDKRQSEDDAGSVSLNMKELLEREWIRREASIEHYYKFFAERFCDSSEIDCTDKLM